MQVLGSWLALAVVLCRCTSMQWLAGMLRLARQSQQGYWFVHPASTASWQRCVRPRPGAFPPLPEGVAVQVLIKVLLVILIFVLLHLGAIQCRGCCAWDCGQANPAQAVLVKQGPAFA